MRTARSRACFVMLLFGAAYSRHCQVENTKPDTNNDYTFEGPWDIKGCSTLLLDHGKCTEDSCPHRVKFVDEEIIELSDQLHENKDLTALSLNSNELTDESVKAVAEALRGNTVLIDIYMSDNQISDEGAAALADALQDNEVVNTLSLMYNNITDVGAERLVELIEGNTAIDSLQLQHNILNNESSISPEMYERIALATKKRTNPPEGEDLEEYYGGIKDPPPPDPDEIEAFERKKAAYQAPVSPFLKEEI